MNGFFGFAFEKMSSSIPVLLVMLFANVGKRLNSRWQMFFKTGVLKNIHRKTTGKHLCWSLPNGYTTSNPRRFDVDITSIRRSQISTNLQVIFTYFFRCNFDGQKIYVISTYFFRCNFAGRKIHVVSTYFFSRNFADRNIHVFSTHFFRCNFDGRKIHVVSTHFFRCNFDRRKFLFNKMHGLFDFETSLFFSN